MAEKLQNFKVRYLATYPATPQAVKDSANPSLWVCEDVMPAANLQDVFRIITEGGGIPLKGSKLRSGGFTVTADYKLKFLLSLLFALESGQSAGAALERTIEAEVWPMRGHLDPALKLLRAGGLFTDALALLHMYDETTMALLSAGEATGNMRQALSTAIEHLKRRRTADSLMRGAVMMILLDIGMALSSSVSNVLGMLPQAEKKGLQTEDPVALAKFHNAIQLGYISNYILIAIALVALGFALVALVGYNYGTSDTKLKVEAMLRKLPFLGAALEHEGVAMSSGVCGHLLKGGVLFFTAADITARAVKQPAVKAYWQEVLEKGLTGVPLTQAMSMPPMTTSERQVLAQHTNAEQLAAALSNIAEYRQEQAAKANKRFVVTGMVSSFGYSALGIATSLYVNYVQVSALLSTGAA